MAGSDRLWPRRLAPLAVLAAASLAAAASFGEPEPDARFPAFLNDVYRQRLERMEESVAAWTEDVLAH